MYEAQAEAHLATIRDWYELGQWMRDLYRRLGGFRIIAVSYEREQPDLETFNLGFTPHVPQPGEEAYLNFL